MDPFTVLTGIAQIADCAIRSTSALVRYTRACKHAANDKRDLLREAYFLLDQLNTLKDTPLLDGPADRLKSRALLSQPFEAAVREFAEGLDLDPSTGMPKHESWASRLHFTTTWAFKKSPVQVLLQRIVRLRQYIHFLITDDQVEMLHMVRRLHQDALDADERKRFNEWLSPLEMSHLHGEHCASAVKGSGNWFLESKPVVDWITGDLALLRCTGIPGAGKTIMASVQLITTKLEETLTFGRSIVIEHLRSRQTSFIHIPSARTLTSWEGLPFEDLTGIHHSGQTPKIRPPTVSATRSMTSAGPHTGDPKPPNGPAVPGSSTTLLPLTPRDSAVGPLASDKIDALRPATEVHVAADKNILVAWIYFTHGVASETTENILGSLLKQALKHRKHIPEMLVRSFLERSEESTPAPVKLLHESLASVIEAMDEAYIVLDALDECSEAIRWRILDILRHCHPKLRLMVISRTSNHHGHGMQDFANIEVLADKDDLRSYVVQCIQQEPTLLSKVLQSKDLRDQIVEAVIRNSDGIFLLARLHMASVVSCASLTIGDLKERLNALSSSLDECYEDTIKRIRDLPEVQMARTFKILAWVSYAMRPLSMEELRHALATKPGDTTLDKDFLLDERVILELCKGLLIIRGVNTVSFVHHTAATFFEKRRAQLFPGFHASITSVCTTYLAFDELTNADMQNIFRDRPFACYAVQFLGHHAHENAEEVLDEVTITSIRRLLTHPLKRKTLLALMESKDPLRSNSTAPRTHRNSDDVCDSPLDPKNDIYTFFSLATTFLDEEDDYSDYVATPKSSDTDEGYSSSRFTPQVTALHIATSWGLARVASMLIKKGADINAIDDKGRTALEVAMSKGLQPIAQQLIRAGALVDLATRHGQDLFLFLVEKRWHRSIMALEGTEQRARLRLHDRTSGQDGALLLAAYHGDVGRLEELLSGSNSCLVKSSAATVALFVAVEEGHYLFAKQILRAGLARDVVDAKGATALHRAVRRNDLEMTELLYHEGLNLEQKDNEGRTAWSANIRTSDEEVLQYLVRVGTDPNTTGPYGVSELYIAARQGEEEIVERMLDSKTYPSIQTQFYWEPLHWAAYYGHHGCVELLLRHGADVSPMSDQDATPLDLAIQTNRTLIVDILKKAGAKQSKDILAASSCLSHGPSLNKAPILKLHLDCTENQHPQSQHGPLIYPANTADVKDHTYQLSQALSCRSDRLNILRHAPSSNGVANSSVAPLAFTRDQALFEIKSSWPDYGRLVLYPGGQCKLEHGVVRMMGDWTGGWKVSCTRLDGTERCYFRTMPRWLKSDDATWQWIRHDGVVIAISGREGNLATLTFAHDVDGEDKVNLVACWVAKLWVERVMAT